MSIFADLKSRLTGAVATYIGDAAFLNAAASACAAVTAADGKIDDSEVDAAISGLMSNALLKGFYTPAKIEEAIGAALVRAKTRAGAMENRRFLDAVAARSPEQRQDIFLLAADVADDGGIGPEERKVLADIAKHLNVDDTKLLG